MITEDYVSFETAKLLKEKGFDEATNRYYNAQYGQIRTVSDTFMWHWNDEEFMKRVLMDGAIAIPTIQMAMKWLREVHNLHIIIECGYGNRLMYFSNIKNTLTNDSLPNDTGYYSTYEEACESAIKYAIENLI